MKSILIKGLDKDQEQLIRGDFASSLVLRKRLIEVLSDKIESNRSTLRNTVTYEDAAWPYRQADGLGYERAIREIISLLE